MVKPELGLPPPLARRDPESEVSQGCPAPEMKSYFISERCASCTWGFFLCGFFLVFFFVAFFFFSVSWMLIELRKHIKKKKIKS